MTNQLVNTSSNVLLSQQAPDKHSSGCIVIERLPVIWEVDQASDAKFFPPYEALVPMISGGKRPVNNRPYPGNRICEESLVCSPADFGSKSKLKLANYHASDGYLIDGFGRFTWREPGDDLTASSVPFVDHLSQDQTECGLQ